MYNLFPIVFTWLPRILGNCVTGSCYWTIYTLHLYYYARLLHFLHRTFGCKIKFILTQVMIIIELRCMLCYYVQLFQRSRMYESHTISHIARTGFHHSHSTYILELFACISHSFNSQVTFVCLLARKQPGLTNANGINRAATAPQK